MYTPLCVAHDKINDVFIQLSKYNMYVSRFESGTEIDLENRSGTEKILSKCFVVVAVVFYKCTPASLLYQ